MRNHNQMQLFRDIIDDCGFLDLGFVGSDFTWRKHFDDGTLIWERLDKGIANSSRFLKFPSTRVNSLSCTSSNHLPLFINP